MDEVTWLTCGKSELMLEFAAAKISKRKLRLFTCACVRQKWSLLSDFQRTAVEVAELYADGQATEDDLRRAYTSAWGSAPSKTLQAACWVACSEPDPMLLAARVATSSIRCLLLREVIGNLFRPVGLDLTWQRSIIVPLVRATYENRILPAGTFAPDRLAVLADALQDAGCAEANILDHLRAPGLHFRGCWCIDLLLNNN